MLKHLFLIFISSTLASTAKALPHQDTTEQVIQKVEFITREKDTIRYIIKPGNPKYTIKNSNNKISDISISLPSNIITTLKDKHIPRIDLYINNKKCIAMANFAYYSGDLKNLDFFFPIDKEGHIIFSRTDDSTLNFSSP